MRSRSPGVDLDSWALLQRLEPRSANEHALHIAITMMQGVSHGRYRIAKSTSLVDVLP